MSPFESPDNLFINPIIGWFSSWVYQGTPEASIDDFSCKHRKKICPGNVSFKSWNVLQLLLSMIIGVRIPHLDHWGDVKCRPSDRKSLL